MADVFPYFPQNVIYNYIDDSSLPLDFIRKSIYIIYVHFDRINMKRNISKTSFER